MDPYRIRGLLILCALTVGVAAWLLLLPPIPQNMDYHRFADRRVFLGIPNFLDVVSNLPFVVLGAGGLIFLLGPRPLRERLALQSPEERVPYVTFYAGVMLTGLGSGWYHISPDNASLFWDRLPMTIIFMSLPAQVICERVSPRAGCLLLAPMLLLGIGSALHWYVTEQTGAGDLRLYAFVQYYPVIPVLFLSRLYPPKYSRQGDLFTMVGAYGLAILLQSLDGQIFSLGGLVSGHTLKHLVAAAAVGLHLRMLLQRKMIGVHAFGDPT